MFPYPPGSHSPHRHPCLLPAIITSLAAVAGCKQSDDPFADHPRHVLLLTVDTLRWDYMSCNGYDQPTTPFLDELIAGGLSFDHATTPVPRTTQALASLLSGCYPHTTKVRTLTDRMAPEIVTIAQLARDAGYQTVAVVSNQMLTLRRGLGRGFDVYDHANDSRGAQATTDAAIHHLAACSEEAPLFVWVHYIDPHMAYEPPRLYARQFDPTYEGPYQAHFGRVLSGANSRQYPPELPKPIAVFRNPLSNEVNAHIRRLYAADIRHVDDNIARLVKWLRNRFGQDWITVVTADHGESLGEHDFFYDHGDYVYEGTLRVPLAIVLPEQHALHRKGRAGEVVSLVDVMPTLLELMNLPLPPQHAYEVEGRSLVPCLRGDTLPPRPAFAECGRAVFQKLVRRRVRFDVAGRFRSVTFGVWKLIWTPEQTEDMEYELYQLAEDPNETNNLYTTSHPKAIELKALLHDWVRCPTEAPRSPDANDLDALRSLGYIE